MQEWEADLDPVRHLRGSVNLHKNVIIFLKKISSWDLTGFNFLRKSTFAESVHIFSPVGLCLYTAVATWLKNVDD